MSHEPEPTGATLEQITDSFVTKLRAGERPSYDEYFQRFPVHAAELKDLLPALVLLEGHAAAIAARVTDVATESGPLPEEIGGYRIVREIGRGGMGIVYEAVEDTLGRHVALKVLLLPGLLSAKHLERFRYEARSAARLHHPNIVPIFGFGESGGVQYYAMQYIRGDNLHEVLAQARRDVDESAENSDSNPTEVSRRWGSGRTFYHSVARIGLQVAEALSYAHSEGVLHRDIKPSNLLVDAKDNVWITDFGLAKVEGSEGLTETGDFLGTLRYMAPERLEGAFDRRSDIYSLGATLYEMLTLHTFFSTSTHAQLVDQILHHAPPSPSRFDKKLPRDLETIVLKATAKEPAARYHTADELAEDFRRYLADRPILSRRPTMHEQFSAWCRRNPLVAGLTAAVAALLISAIVVLLRSNARIRNEAAARDRAVASARGTIHDLLTRVATDKLENIPLSHPLRVSLLDDAAEACQELLAIGDTDHDVRSELADILHMLAGLQRELNQHGEAADSLRRSATLYESIIDTDPSPPAVRESLAMVQADLAYTWQFDNSSPHAKSFPVAEQYQRALDAFESIERDWPQRPQPTILCLRSLAELAFHRGDRVTAEKLWKKAISRGETYVRHHPENIRVRTELCWACINFHESILSQDAARADEADRLLARGVEHAERMQRQDPNDSSALDVLASLHFRQGIAAADSGNIDQAIPRFHLAMTEIETLCESVPWNADYWNSSSWFREEAIQRFHQAGMEAEVTACVERSLEVFRRIDAITKDDALAQERLTNAQTSLDSVLQSIGYELSAQQVLAPPKRN